MSRTTRVLFAIGSLAGGGAERQTINYLRHLDRGRFTPLLYLHYRQGELLIDVPDDVPVLSFWENNSHPRLNYPGRILGAQVRDLARVLKEEKIDVLCAVTFLLSLVASASVRRRPTPWLAIEMADPRLDFENQTKRFRWIKRRLLARAYRRADRGVAVSEGVRDGIAETYGVPRETIDVVRNFIDVADVDRMTNAPSPTLTPNRFHIAVVGRLDVQKGHIHLLRAMVRLIHEEEQTDIQLHLLGQGPLERELREFVGGHNLDDHVHFVGFVQNVPAYLRACHLFCLPSLYEGLPLALLEAMACRVPIVATDCPSGPREVLGDGKYGRLVAPANPDALAGAIRDAVDNYDDWQAVMNDARKHVEESYSADTGIRALQDLIETIK